MKSLVDHINEQFGQAVNLSYGLPNPLDNAKELIQDLSVKVFTKNAEGYFDGKSDKERGRIINKILYNLNIDKWRERNVQPKTFLYLDDCSDYWENETGLFNIASVDNNVWGKLLSDEIYKRLKIIPKNFMVCFILTTLQGYKNREVAKVLNMKLSTVIGCTRYARRELKKIIAA